MAIMPREIVAQVTEVLRAARTGKGPGRCFLTAYQILDRLPVELRDQIIAERTIGGRGAGVPYGAPSVVSDALQLVPEIEIDFMDSVGVSIQTAGRQLTPSNEVCALYRLP